MVPLAGFEPTFTGRKPVVLPLDDRGMVGIIGFAPISSPLSGVSSAVELYAGKKSDHIVKKQIPFRWVSHQVVLNHIKILTVNVSVHPCTPFPFRLLETKSFSTDIKKPRLGLPAGVFNNPEGISLPVKGKP
jgi:hypothetical protein